MFTFLRDHFWQTTLFTVGVWTASWVLRNQSARARYVLWMTAGVKFAIPAVFIALLAVGLGFDPTWIHPEPSPAPTDSATGTFALDTSRIGFQSPKPVQSSRVPVFLCGGLWFTGSLLLSALWLRRLRATARGVRSGERVTGGREARILAGALARTGHAAPVPLILCDGDLEPGAWGIFRPAVVLPRPLAKLLSDEELEAVFLHELTHIVRRDNLFAVAQTLLRCVWWFHPLVWLVDRRLSEERELACDEAVLRLGGCPQAYLAGMHKILRTRLCPQPVAGVSMLTGPDFKKRITMMNRHFSSPVKLSLVTTVSAIGLIAFSTAAGMDRGWTSSPAASKAAPGNIGVRPRTQSSPASTGDETGVPSGYGKLPRLDQTVSVKEDQIPVGQFCQTLSKLTGEEILIVPLKKDGEKSPVSVDIANIRLHELLGFLQNNYGGIYVNGMDFEKLTALKNAVRKNPDHPVSLTLSGQSPERIKSFLGFLAGRNLEFTRPQTDSLKFDFQETSFQKVLETVGLR